jgi:hypothetical protein
MEAIQKAIEAFVATHGGGFEDYYIGITTEPQQQAIEEMEIIKAHLERGEYIKGMPIEGWVCASGEEAILLAQYYIFERRMNQLDARFVPAPELNFLYCHKLDWESKVNVQAESYLPYEDEVRKRIRGFVESHFKGTQ